MFGRSLSGAGGQLLVNASRWREERTSHVDTDLQCGHVSQDYEENSAPAPFLRMHNGELDAKDEKS